MDTNNINAETIDEEKIAESIDKNTKAAEELLNDPDKMEKFLQKLEKKLETVPIAGSSLAYVPLMISLVRMWIKKEYTEPPVVSMVSIVAALIYVLSPIDLIPDAIPGVGLIDDGLIITACLALVKTDLQDYRAWRIEHGMVVDDLPDYDDITSNADSINKYIKAFMRGRKSAGK